jgi:hypothetical protein
MASYTTIEDWQDVEGGYVVDVTIRRTGDDQHPCGWDYSFHLGRTDGTTILRYDNAHERVKGHERHTAEEVETIEFPGLLELYDRFTREAEALSSVSWDWPM